MNSIKHVDNLINIFSLNIKSDKYKLSLFDQLVKIENELKSTYVDSCNGTISDQDVESIELFSMRKLLGLLENNKNNIPIEFNDDPCGYAIKINSDYVHENNLNIHRDMGGYGIIVPEY